MSKVDELEECLGEGPLDFTIVQEKIALRFFSPRNWRKGAGDGGEFQVLSCGVGGENDEKYSKQSFSMFTWNVTRTAFMSLTASLEELLYFFGGMDLFFCKKKGRKKRKK